MERRSSAIARVLAALALIATVVALLVVVSAGLDDGGSQGEAGPSGTTTQAEPQSEEEPKAKVYVIKPGDNLTSIAEKTGVSVSELQTLNPEVDPQILVAGETLKLR